MNVDELITARDNLLKHPDAYFGLSTAKEVAEALDYAIAGIEQPSAALQNFRDIARCFEDLRRFIEAKWPGVADLPSPDGVLLNGPEWKHETDAMISALNRVADFYESDKPEQPHHNGMMMLSQRLVIAERRIAELEAGPVLPDIASNQVNDAAWKLHDRLGEYGPLTGHQFNNLKGCFYEALKVCMEVKP